MAFPNPPRADGLRILYWSDSCYLHQLHGPIFHSFHRLSLLLFCVTTPVKWCLNEGDYCKFACILLQTLAVGKLLGEAPMLGMLAGVWRDFFIFFPFLFLQEKGIFKIFLKGLSSQGHSWNKTPEYFTLAEVVMPDCCVHEWLEGRRIFFQICLIKMPLQFSVSFISIDFQRLSKQSYTGLYFKCAIKTW